ncbi:MAG TPA: phosphopantothenoylcysteine decarboxylase [Verrucomicrobiae bacterium]|nr:phosphopantothenoylcysteine decarboxylase [Verrucomicrobiae bacterium]
MKVIVTTGPSFEPIDEVRRLTNFSTGELGVMLANRLAASGCQVFCLKGVGATYAGALHTPHHLPFTTNQDLQDQLVELSRSHSIQALFHVAALCDFKVKQVEGAHGQAQASAKIDSRVSGLTLQLEPAKKIISGLRALFPAAVLVGWKYELAGTRQEALAKAWRQLQENRTDACVLNGRAYGPGFAFCTLPEQVHELRQKAEVADYLAKWLLARRSQ